MIIKTIGIIVKATNPTNGTASNNVWYLLSTKSLKNCLLLLNTFAMKTKFKYIFTQLFGTLYATSDEIHQLFVADRECHIRDIFIDSCGVALGALIVLLIIHLHKKHKAKKLETANITN